MTEQENKDLSDAKLSLTCIPEGSPTRKIWERILDDWQKKDQALACLRKAVKGVLPSLDGAFRRYGCAGKNCGTWRCPVGYPCQAWVIRQSANDLRECLGDAGRAE